jgi:hypothetical protein
VIVPDVTPPKSSATSPGTDTTGSFTVDAQANDPGSDSTGVKTVDLYVKKPGESSFGKVATNTSGTFTYSVPTDSSSKPVNGTYAFFTIAHDNAGNDEALKSAEDTHTLEDTLAPGITISSPSNGGSYVKGSTLNAAASCSDGAAGSGVKTCGATLAIGTLAAQTSTLSGLLDTATIGAHKYTIAAVDNVDNQSSQSASYFVTYNSNGAFMAPVYNVPSTIVNSVKAGQAVPLKFTLHGNQGLSVFASGYPMSQAIILASGATTDSLATDTAGQSSLSYDSTTDTYTYVWKTDRNWAGTARQLVILLNDGVTYFRANFSFTK